MENQKKASNVGLWVAVGLLFVFILIVSGGLFAWQSLQQVQSNEKLQVQINSLEGKIESLESENKNLEKEVEDTQKELDKAETSSTSASSSKDLDTSGNQGATTNREVEWRLVSGDPKDTCSTPTFTGEKTIRGYYSFEENYVEKEWLFVLVEEDIKKLPLQDVSEEFDWFNRRVVLSGASSDLETQLRNASKDNPVEITIDEYSAYCEGQPSVSLK